MQTRSSVRALKPHLAITEQPVENETPPQPRVISRFLNFSKKFNHEVLKNLTYGVRLSPIKTGRVAISHQLFKHIKETYNLTGRFKVNQQRFLLDFQIIQRRAFPPNTFCIIQCETFALRLANGRRIKYYNEDMHQMLSISNQKFIVFRFVKENIIP
jgi:hypothetical protein